MHVLALQYTSLAHVFQLWCRRLQGLCGVLACSFFRASQIFLAVVLPSMWVSWLTSTRFEIVLIAYHYSEDTTINGVGLP